MNAAINNLQLHYYRVLMGVSRQFCITWIPCEFFLHVLRGIFGMK